MKILIIGIDSAVEPLGIIYIVAVLRKEGHQVDLDLIPARNRQVVSKVKLKLDYDFIGFSFLTGPHEYLLALAWRYKEAGVKTIAGGPHATFFSKETLPFVDFVVMGEGIKSVLEIIDGQISLGSIVKSELIQKADDFPFPDREILYRDFRKRKNPIKNMITTFGCPFSCSYCYNSKYNRIFPGYGVRMRSVANVIEEAQQLLQYPLEMVFFQDDQFGLKMDWLEEFTRQWSREIKIPFQVQLRPEDISREQLNLLKKAGCIGINLGLETYNEKIRQELLNRKGSNQQITKGCRLIKEFGFWLRAYLMIGLPETTIEDDLNTLKWMCQIKPDVTRPGIYMPLKGTVLGDYCIEKGFWSGEQNGFSEMPIFDETVLNFPPEHRRQLSLLQSSFYLLARLPKGEQLARNLLSIDKSKLDLETFFWVARQHLYDIFFSCQSPEESDF